MQPDQYLWDIILFVVLIGLSAFFSGSETAFLSLSQMQPSQLKTGKASVDERLRKMHSRMQELLIAILVGNTLVNITAATVAALLASKLAEAWHLDMNIALLVEVIAVTLILLVFSEITPKLAAIKKPLRFAARVSLPIFAYVNLIRPITFLLQAFTDLTSKLFGVTTKKFSLDEEELRILVEVGEERGALEEEEKEMIHSILEFGETQVKEVMVPRIDMVCVEKGASIDEVIDLIKTKGHTRIPLYDELIDNILGLIHAKDLLPYVKEREQKVDLTDLARPILFVPESKLIDELLEEFQLKKIHMAIVVDEYGGTAGLVTLEDVLEEIVGEIQDEYDRETPLYKKVGANTFLVNAKIDLHDLNRELGLDLPTESDYESLGGFIFSQTGSVPREKEVIPYKNVKFVVEKVDRNRIVQVRVEIGDEIDLKNG